MAPKSKKLPDESEEEYQERIKEEAKQRKMGALAAGLKGLGDVGTSLSGGPTGAMAPLPAGVAKGSYSPTEAGFRTRGEKSPLLGRTFKKGGSVKKNRDGKAIRGLTKGRFV